MATLTIIGVMFGANLVLTTIFLWFGARWLKADRPFLSRAALAMIGTLLVSMLTGAVTAALVATVASGEPAIQVPIELAAIVGQVVGAWLIISRCFRVRFVKAIGVWAVSLIPSVAAVALLFLIVKPFLLEAFVVPANSMAPTVVGWHRTAPCPHCGQPMVVPMPDPEEQRAFEVDSIGICISCRKTAETERERSPSPPEFPDRIMVNKLVSPRRWDIVAFRHPKTPDLKYIKRLVGFPGETMFIEDGRAWINGMKLEPPPELAGLNYTTMPAGFVGAHAGTREDPWRLGPDEYFALGDFSERSSDSRDWGPLPAANIEGVVSLRYWPATRWAIFR